MDIQWSPDGKLFSFVRKNNLWMYNIEKEIEIRITQFSDDPNSTVSVTPDFVMQEEFDRFSGVAWAPSNQKPGLYRLAYIKVDTEPVPLLALPTSEISEPTPETHRFARPGERNAVEEVFVVEFNETGSVSKQLQTVKSIKELFSTIEYIARLNWSVDGQKLYLQLLDRVQKSLLWVQASFEKENQFNFDIFRHDKTDIWINLSDIFHSANDGTVIYSSECNSDCFRHLYLFDKTEIQLTSGSWGVDQVFAVDEKTKTIYFSASKDSPIQVHLYRVK